MEILKLMRPTKKDEKAAYEFINEFHEHHSNINGTGGLDRYIDDYDSWLLKLKEDRQRKEVNEEKVPAETYFLVRVADTKIIGMVNIRLALNEKLKKYGGHIGYCIRPTQRGKGYNKINLYLALLVCQQYQIEEVLIDCDKDNLASAKTIQALGGKLVKEYRDDITKEVIQNYIIHVKQAINENKSKYNSMVIFDLEV